MKRALFHRFIYLLAGIMAWPAMAAFDPTMVYNLSVQFIPAVSGAEVSPFPFLLGDTTVPTVTATLVGPITGVPVPDNFLTLTSQNTNVIRVGPGFQLTAIGYGSTTLSFHVGYFTLNKAVKVVGPAAQLMHRYSFDTNADPTLVFDSIGSAHGRLTNDLSGGTFPLLIGGEAQFDGGGGYVKLPAGVASQFTNLSLAVWVTADNPTNVRFGASRLLDFAMPNTNTPPGRSNGLALDMDEVLLRAAWGSQTQEVRFSWQPFTGNFRTGLVAAMASPSQLLFGQAGSAAQTLKSPTNFPPLSALIDTDNRIGGSLASGFSFRGNLTEVRMYEGLLSDYDLALMRTNGPDMLPGSLGELRRIHLAFDSTPLQFGNPQPNTYQVLGDFTGVSNVDLIAAGLVSLSAPFGTNGPLLLIGTNQIKAQGIGPVNLTVVSRVAQSNLAIIPVAIAPPLQVRLQLPATNFSSRSPPIPYSLRGDYLYVSNVDLTGSSQSHYSLSDNIVFQFRPGFTLLPEATGTSVLSGQYSGVGTSVQLTVANPAGFAATYPQLRYRWQFNEPVGSYYAYDSINSNVVVLFASQIYSDINNNTQPVGILPAFDGVSTAHTTGAAGYFTGSYGILQPLTNCTIEIWLRCSYIKDYIHFFDVFQPSNPYSSNPYLSQANPLAGSMFLAPASTGGSGGVQAVFQPGGADTNQYYRLQAPSALVLNAWTHVVWVHSPALGVAELYLDGVQVAATNTSIPFPSTLMSYVWLGRNSSSPNQCFAGDYDEVRIYDGALTPAQIQMNHDVGAQVLALGPAAAAYPWFGVRPELDGQHLKVRIPNPRSGVVLETSPALGSNGVWTAVPTPPQTEPDETTSVEVAAGTNAFFRLHLVH